ncbi:NF-kappa-B inhibitor-like protein 1 [Argonauta hians]
MDKLKKKRCYLNKVAKYIQNNRPRRAEKYIEKHKLKQYLTIFTNTNGENLLHMCCYFTSSWRFLRYLIHHNVDPLQTDNNGDFPHHHAVHKLLSIKDAHEAQSVYHDFVQPFLENYSTCLKLKNKFGNSTEDLLSHFLECQGNMQSTHSEDECKDHQENEEWMSKLQDAFNDEYESNWGRYENDDFNDDRQWESYDCWADRIASAKRRKEESRRYQYSSKKHHKKLHKEKSKTASPKNNVSQPKKLVIERKLSELEFLRNEKKYKKLLNGNQNELLSYDRFPWPRDNQGTCLSYQSIDKLHIDNTSENRMLIRKLQRRWHPDKFMQNFGNRLLESDKDLILQKINEIAKTLNKISENLV